MEKEIFDIVSEYDGAEGGYSDELTRELLDLFKAKMEEVLGDNDPRTEETWQELESDQRSRLKELLTPVIGREEI